MEEEEGEEEGGGGRGGGEDDEARTRYQSAMLSMRMGLIWMLWLCQACARITPELGCAARNTWICFNCWI